MTANDSHRIDLKYLALFFATAIFTGFTLGTLTLLGPVRWTVAALRKRGVGEQAEQVVVVIYILVLLLVTLIISSALATYLESERPKWKRILAGLVTVSLAVVANYFWTSPALMRSNMGKEDQLAMFTFGPYPDEAKLRELKSRGFTGVISLLHPAVVPFEPQLIKDEEVAAEHAGIRLIEAPMLPWISDNRSSVQMIRKLAADKTARYYVHCYLGMDRVGIVKRIVEQEAGATTVLITEKKREALHERRFERGYVVRLNPSLFVGPYPTHEEWLKVISAKVQNVVSLSDVSEPEHKLRLEETRNAIEPYRLKHHVINLTTVPYSADAMQRAVEQVRALPGITFVHEFYGPGTGRAPLAESFIAAYKSGRWPHVPMIASQPLQAGPMRLLDVDVAVGPRPGRKEIIGRLVENGARMFVCLGGPSDACSEDEKICDRYKLSHITATGEADLTEILRGNGPFYIYDPKNPMPGALVERLVRQRTERFAFAAQ